MYHGQGYLHSWGTHKVSKDNTKCECTNDCVKKCKKFHWCFLEWARKLSPFQEVKPHLVHGPYFIFVCSLWMWALAVPCFLNVLSHTGHSKILMPKVFMYEDRCNFFAPKSTTVGTSLGTSGCDGVVGTGVLSITFFVGFIISSQTCQIRIFSHNFLQNCHPPSLHFISLSNSVHCPQQFCHIFALSGLWVILAFWASSSLPSMSESTIVSNKSSLSDDSSPIVTKSVPFISPRSSKLMSLTSKPVYKNIKNYKSCVWSILFHLWFFMISHLCWCCHANSLMWWHLWKVLQEEGSMHQIMPGGVFRVPLK